MVNEKKEDKKVENPLDKEPKKEELDRMAEDIKKAIGKEKAELVEKTIQETREKLQREKELAEMKAKLEAIEKAKEEEEKKHQAELEAIKNSFKEETEKLVKEFQDSRKSVINTDNPFNSSNNSDANNDILAKYRNDEAFRKELDENSRRAFYDMLDGRY